MNTKEFKNGVLSATLGSLWWGVIGTYFFQFITFVGTLEVVVHRCIWTSFILLFTTLIFKKWHLFKKNLINKKNFFILFITSILIFGNWTAWIYAVATNRIIDASYGYFIFPILTVFLDYLFLKEKLNKKRIFSILIVIGSSIYLAFNLSSFPSLDDILNLSPSEKPASIQLSPIVISLVVRLIVVEVGDRVVFKAVLSIVNAMLVAFACMVSAT